MNDDSLTWLFGIEKFFGFVNDIEKKTFIRHIINMKYSESKSKLWPLKELISVDYTAYPDAGRSDRLNFYTNICAEDALDTGEIIYIMSSIWPNDLLVNKLHQITLLNDNILSTVFSKSQVLSKLWMAEALNKTNALSFDNVLLIGGWLTHHSLFLKDIKFNRLYSIDPDADINPLINIMNPDAHVSNKNIEECFDNNNNIIFNSQVIQPDLVINTSAEHMDNTWYEKLKPGTPVLLQSNSSPEYGHINYCADFGIFLKKYPMSTLYFRGETVFPKYRRFMLYGAK